MPRAYTIAAAALALGVPAKWLDNTLSHIRVPGVHQQRQGVTRRLTLESLLTLAIAITLAADLGVPLIRAIDLAIAIVAADGHIASKDGLQLTLHLPTFRSRLLERLESAVEIAPLPRRGRPPKNTTGRLD